MRASIRRHSVGVLGTLQKQGSQGDSIANAYQLYLLALMQGSQLFGLAAAGEFPANLDAPICGAAMRLDVLAASAMNSMVPNSTFACIARLSVP